MIDVSLVPCATYAPGEIESALRAVLAPVGGLDFVVPGMTVGIKANLVSAMKPEDAATTHPALLCALVRMLKAAGAGRVIVGDSPGGLFTAAYVGHIYKVTGMEAIEEAGGELNRNFGQKSAVYPEGRVLKSLTYTAWLDECDALIDFCKLKTHGMMGMTCAVKNMYGIVPGSVKSEYHYRYSNPMDFARMIVDLNLARPAQLHIVDAVVGMEGNGPTAGTPRPIGCLLASCNPYRLDMICAGIIGLPPACIPTIAAAQERALSPKEIGEITVSDPWQPYIVPDFKNIRNAENLLHQDGNAAIWGKALNRLLRAAMSSRPGVQKEECIGCAECQRICPAKVITMVNGKPRIDRKKCIKCFCCQEFCPVGAMKVHRSPIARLLEKI